jgi:hypothetical protein
MCFRVCAAVLLALFSLGAKQADVTRAELDHLKAAGASDEKVAQAARAYSSVTATTADDEKFRSFNAAMIDVRDDVIRKRVAFIREARQRLEPHGASVTDENIAAWSEGRQTPSILDDEKWAAASDRVYTAAKAVNEKSHVTFLTEKAGATVRYQTLKDAQKKNEPKIADQSTNCTQDVTPAGYYIWTERHGKATSQKHEWDIIEPVRTIKLPEDQ